MKKSNLMKRPMVTERATSLRTQPALTLRRRDAQLFNISHETGDLSQYDTTVIDSGDLSVKLQAGLRNNLTIVGSELIINGDFTNWTSDDPDDWTVVGEVTTDPEISEVGSGEGHGGVGSGMCNIFTSGAYVVVRQNLTLEVGKTYQITIDIDTIVSGALAVLHDVGSPDFGETFTTTGTKKIIFVANTTSLNLDLKRTGATDITIDSISCKEVMGTTYGMQCLIDDTVSIYAEKNFNPPQSGLLRGRFYVDPRQVTMAADDAFVLFRFSASSLASFVGAVTLERNTAGTDYEIKSFYGDDSGNNIGISTVISAGIHYIEVACARASTNSTSDGTVEVFIDNVSVALHTGIDNYDVWDFIINARLGAFTAPSPTTKGELFLDEMVVRDDSIQIGA